MLNNEKMISMFIRKFFFDYKKEMKPDFKNSLDFLHVGKVVKIQNCRHIWA